MQNQRLLKNLNDFPPISLEGLEKVEFMNRVDSKFLFPVNILPDLLSTMVQDYFILEIDKDRHFQYVTTYYDDDDFTMYNSHHNQCLNRYKIRYRTYVNSCKSYLEMKFKSNKKRTLKKRKCYTVDELKCGCFDQFVTEHTQFDPQTLKEKMTNSFSRITLVNRKFTERLTIDFDLAFRSPEKELELSFLGIAEIKNDRKWTSSEFYQLGKNFGLRKCGFSKYSIGCTLLFPHLKANRFKPTHLQLNKFEHAGTSCNG